MVPVPNFLDHEEAKGIRAAFEKHFLHPESHGAQHQIWNYWYVPGQYAYLRTFPERILGEDLVRSFLLSLRIWVTRRLGSDIEPTRPYLSLYVNGCRQGIHNDAGNGRFGYVWSLTPDDHRFIGGETLIFRRGDPYVDRPAAGTGFYESFPPLFNQLLVFDDTAPHAVEAISGSMDPLDGRVVLHGHLK